MKREQLSDIISNIDDRFVAEAITYDPARRSRSPERNGTMRTKRNITLALAATLLLALGIGAYAIGMGIHRQRQAEMRESFCLGNSDPPSYVEYDAPEESTRGVTLLSAVNNGEIQRVFLNVSPVTQEDLALTQNPVQVSRDGGASWEEAITAGDENTAYDAETQTLTVSYQFRVDETTSTVVLMFQVNGGPELGSIAVDITDADSCFASLPEPIVLTNPATGNTVRFLAVELRGNQAVWTLESEDADYLYGDHSSDNEADKQLWKEKSVLWINWLDEQFRATKLYFADGSSCSFNGHEFSDVDGNLVRPHVDYDRLAIDVSQVVSIEMNGQTYKIR